MKNSRNYKFLIIPADFSAYDRRMVEGLKNGFESMGYYAAAMAHPLSAKSYVDLCKAQDFNVVIQVNGIKPAIEMPANIRYISWMQDVFLNTNDLIKQSPLGDGDILYSLGDPTVLGLEEITECFSSTLFTGVSPELLTCRHPGRVGAIDFSLCGYIPKPVDFSIDLKRLFVWHINRIIGSVPILGKPSLLESLLVNPILTVKLHDYVSAAYEPLTGSLDINFLEDVLRGFTVKYSDLRKRRKARSSAASRFLPKNLLDDLNQALISSGSRNVNRLGKLMSGQSNSSAYERAINYFSQSFPRQIDRVTLASLALGVSPSFEIYGSENWLAYDEFKGQYRGDLRDLFSLIHVYRKSKINLANNTHGLGIHSRVLECMAVGGFIFHHESPNDRLAGGMLSQFEPGVHFGQYTKLNFGDESRKWLRDDKSRMLAGEEARKVVSKSHLWRHRAEKIISDLLR